MIQENFLNKHKVNTNCLSAITTCFTITMSVTGFTRIPRNVFEQIYYKHALFFTMSVTGSVKTLTLK